MADSTLSKPIVYVVHPTGSLEITASLRGLIEDAEIQGAPTAEKAKERLGKQETLPSVYVFKGPANSLAETPQDSEGTYMQTILSVLKAHKQPEGKGVEHPEVVLLTSSGRTIMNNPSQLHVAATAANMIQKQTECPSVVFPGDLNELEELLRINLRGLSGALELIKDFSKTALTPVAAPALAS